MSEENNLSEQPGFRLQLTGKTAIVFELENFGPITFNINDLEQSTDLLKQVLNVISPTGTMSVDSYATRREEKTLSKILFKPREKNETE